MEMFISFKFLSVGLYHYVQYSCLSWDPAEGKYSEEYGGVLFLFSLVNEGVKL